MNIGFDYTQKNQDFLLRTIQQREYIMKLTFVFVSPRFLLAILSRYPRYLRGYNAPRIIFDLR